MGSTPTVGSSDYVIIKAKMSKVKRIQDNIQEIKEHMFFSDILILGFLASSLLLLGILFLIILLGIKPSDVLIQVRFDSFTGVSKLGVWLEVYNLLIVGALIGVVNTVLSYIAYEKERLISIFLLVGVVISEIILITEALNIVKLVNI